MNEDLPTCGLCGWQDRSRRGKPDHCPRCLRLEEMFHAWMPVSEIGKRLEMTTEDVRDVVRQLE